MGSPAVEATDQETSNANSPQRIQRLVAAAKEQQPTHTPMASIEQSPRFQKRSPDVEGKARQVAIRDADKAMMEKFVSDLENPEHTTDPVTLCRVNGALILVDGHHRLDAYRLAGRNDIPSRVLETTESEAHTLASVMNGYSTTVPRGNEERGETAWREVLDKYDGESWEDGWSARQLAKVMGVGSKTVDRMVKARKAHGDGADHMTWKQARASEFEREYSSRDKVAGWISAIDKINAQSEHEVEVIIELVRQCNEVYAGREEMADKFAAYLDDPKAFRDYHDEALSSF
ncbi:ParB N-terminal domain-containing protein [Motiliproteus sp.]|uniref:ParB/RepB/Spo0J family partition protein n=1 Tax=Motiliproteus sp. TaxID=1898955 RepID=UPI003BA9A639